MGGNGTFIGNNISGFENGIFTNGGANIVIKGNYIHDLQNNGSDPHYDGMQVMGGEKNLLIEGNTVLGRGNSDLFINSQWAPISGVTIKNNYLAGSSDIGYTMYIVSDDKGGLITNAVVTDNYIEKGQYGYLNTYKASPVMSGNIQWDASKTAAPAGPAAPTPDPTPRGNANSGSDTHADACPEARPDTRPFRRQQLVGRNDERWRRARHVGAQASRGHQRQQHRRSEVRGLL